VQVELPFDAFVGIMRDTRPDMFDPQKMERITIFQGLDDDKPHTVYIDEITISDAPQSPAKAPAAPPGLAAKATIATSI
jgi:exo beta-1,2-glucooligosaccharide sophorohydrolase (non-reducing end)